METQIIGVGEDTQILAESTTDAGVNFTGGLLQIHEQISGWEVVSKFGAQSGEADIYLVEKDGSQGVIKYYRNTIKPKTEILDKIKGLNHRDIINVFEYGYYRDRFFEIMEYAEGGALDRRNTDGSYTYLPLSEETVVEIGKEIISAYKTCHESGIIHRDIKPANLYCRSAEELPDGRFTVHDVVIADFGISSVMDAAAGSRKTQTASRTTGYAAPEVLSGIITAKMDYYALGITLWELLTGKDPFVLESGKRRNEAHLIRDTIEGRIADDILSREPRVSRFMEHLIRGLLVIDEAHRWGYDEVTRYLAGETVDVYQKQKKQWTFTIGDTPCTTLEQLGDALINNPEASKKYIFKGLLAGFLEDEYPDYAKEIVRIAEESSAKKNDEQGILRIAYFLNPASPLNAGNGFFASNIDDVVSLLENAPETMLPLLKDRNSKLYVYLENIRYGEYIPKIQELIGTVSDLELLGKAEVLLRNKIIRPFKLEKFVDVELSTLEQIRRVPRDMQKRMLSIIDTRSYEGLFMPWVDIMTPTVSVDQMNTAGWPEFLESLGTNFKVDVHLSDGNSLLEERDYEKALEEFTKAIKLTPEDGKVFFSRGMVYYAMEKYNKAEADFSISLEMDPHNGETFFQRGMTYFSMEKYNKAASDFSASLEMDANNSKAWLYRGMVYLKREDYPKALADFEAALRIDPDLEAAVNLREEVRQKI
ncbi:hypothetical protein AGMMS49944_18990 [Spirochaetia bacterium]|nr:hypothetical protein AGMMS49944_18990 [Spirochaetia bacterium]